MELHLEHIYTKNQIIEISFRTLSMCGGAILKFSRDIYETKTK